MYEDFSDSDLLRRLSAAGEQDRKGIFLTLYERYKQLVLKISYYYLADYEQANDNFHDVFVKVIENAEKLENPDLFKSWLMKTTRNLCVDRLRRSAHRSGNEATSAEIEVACDERVEDRYIAEMDRQRILKQLVSCIQNLDEKHLCIFKLRWKGFRAAQILNIVKLDKQELRRSYDRIKNLLEDCMKSKGLVISIDQIILLGEFED
jgi:RNA polymerase sigma-70 factor (ECF subfamily)